MHDLTTFEQRLATRLDAEVSRALPTFDASGIAAAAIVRRNPWDVLVNTFGVGRGLPMRTSRRVLIVAVAALLVVATIALAIGFLHSGSRQLAYIGTSGEVVVANLDGSDPRVIGRVGWSPLRNEVTWAPGGGHLATFGEDWLLTIVDPAGRVTFSRKLDDRSSRWAWSPDGTHLAVLDGGWARESETIGAVVDPHLFIVSADGVEEAASDLPSDLRYQIGQGGIAWSPDGRELAVTGFDRSLMAGGTSSSIWIVDRATLAAREIHQPGSPAYDVDPAWLPDGRILFARENGGIWQIDPHTDAAAQVFAPQCPCSGHTIVPFVPSPDATRLAIVTPNVGLAVLDLASGSLTELGLPDGTGGNLPIGWVADGTALTVMVGPITDEPFWASELGILDIATGKLTVVATDVASFDAAN